jgi:hypothetical protein
MMNMFCRTMGMGVPGRGMAIYAPMDMSAAKRQARTACPSSCVLDSMIANVALKNEFSQYEGKIRWKSELEGHPLPSRDASW